MRGFAHPHTLGRRARSTRRLRGCGCGAPRAADEAAALESDARDSKQLRRNRETNSAAHESGTRFAGQTPELATEFKVSGTTPHPGHIFAGTGLSPARICSGTDTCAPPAAQGAHLNSSGVIERHVEVPARSNGVPFSGQRC